MAVNTGDIIRHKMTSSLNPIEYTTSKYSTSTYVIPQSNPSQIVNEVDNSDLLLSPIVAIDVREECEIKVGGACNVMQTRGCSCHIPCDPCERLLLLLKTEQQQCHKSSEWAKRQLPHHPTAGVRFGSAARPAAGG